jgi:uncharacterized protein YndB with AHSA1/START domain
METNKTLDRQNLVARQSLHIKAPVENVWHTITTPEMIKQYLYGTEAVTDWKIGSPILFRGEWNGNHYEDKGIILDLQAPQLLRHTYWSSVGGKEDVPENYNTVTYLLTPENNGTLITIMQDGIDNDDSLLRMNENWTVVLRKLKEVVEMKNE